MERNGNLKRKIIVVYRKYVNDLPSRDMALGVLEDKKLPWWSRKQRDLYLLRDLNQLVFLFVCFLNKRQDSPIPEHKSLHCTYHFTLSNMVNVISVFVHFNAYYALCSNKMHYDYKVLSSIKWELITFLHITTITEEYIYVPALFKPDVNRFTWFIKLQVQRFPDAKSVSKTCSLF